MTVYVSRLAHVSGLEITKETKGKKGIYARRGGGVSMYVGAPRLTFFDVRGLGERSPAGWR